MSTKALCFILVVTASLVVAATPARAALQSDFPAILLEKAIERDGIQKTSQFLYAAMVLMLDGYPSHAREIIEEAKAKAPERASEIDRIAAHYFAAAGEDAGASRPSATKKPNKNGNAPRRIRSEKESLKPGSFFGFSGWSGELELGGAFTTGNTEERALDALVKLRRENATWRHEAQSEFEWTNTDDETTRRRLQAEYQLAYNLSRRSYLFGLAAYEDDRFSGFDYRLLESFGFGYRILSGESYFIDVEAGAIARQSVVEATGVSEDEYGSRFNAILEWDITDKLTFENEASALVMDGSTTIETSTGLKVGFSKALAARLRFDYERNSNVPAGKKKTRTKTGVTLVYGF